MNNPFQVDLLNCDLEPIHILGKVQSHGFLIAVDKKFVVRYISQNCLQFLPKKPELYLGTHIDIIQKDLGIDETNISVSQLLKLHTSTKGLDSFNPIPLEINNTWYNLIFSLSGNDYILIEFEQLLSDLITDVNKQIGKSISEILKIKTLKLMLKSAASEVKQLIQYDRVMIYKFNEEGHGEVISEDKNDDLEPFLGLHYPATDIPKQARELYKINLTRIIADVNAADSPILTASDNTNQLDLTNSSIRSVSPIHIQYLKNMGVASSFSISLMSKGNLWGLIACHNYSPRFINFDARNAAKLIGQILSSALEHVVEEENFDFTEKLNNSIKSISQQIDDLPSLTEALFHSNTNLLDLTKANGVALVFENKIIKSGNTPNDSEIKDIAAWLKQNMEEDIFKSNQFPKIYTKAEKYAHLGSGILACLLSKELSEYIIWFKPEQLTSIDWAGKPEKSFAVNDDGIMTLTPRKSFDTWSEIVRLTSDKWSDKEISAVITIRQKIINAINKRANEIRILNEKLNIAYDELDTFSYTIAHDLRTPLSSIKSYAELLMMNNKSIDDKGKSILQKIVTGADKMNFLIKEILNYSRVGRNALNFEEINMSQLLHDIKTELLVRPINENLKIEIVNSPNLKGDKTMITQVFYNLINNAVKYSSKSKHPIVKIDAEIKEDEIIYKVSDNGIGIDINYHSKVFELFKRMDNVQDIEGTGVGLAIVKRIIEKHDAQIWFDSEINSGTVFYTKFKIL